MANIFAILTALALAISAYLALKNKDAYERQIEGRQRAERQLTVNKERFDDLSSKRDATLEETKATQETTVSLREQEAALQASNPSLESEIESAKRKAASNQSQVEEIAEKTAELGEIEDLARQIQKLQESIVSMEDEKTMKESVQSGLLAEQSSIQETIEGYSNEARSITKKESYGSAAITAIYEPWGFVTLSKGSSGGIVAGSTLDVVRGGEVVAKLQVRSVEPSRASADLVPDSIGDDVDLRVGDRVEPGASTSGEN